MGFHGNPCRVSSLVRHLQKLIFDKNIGLVTAWKNADALQQMEELSHVLKWARLSTAVTDAWHR